MNDIMVSIVCISYNHERYIRQALEGFLMQKVDFKYEILINDDASTDGTTSIIKEYQDKYPDIIKAFYQDKNLYSQGIRVTNYLLQFAKGKYIALCEGDDFWIDSNKLQLQVDFMEQNKECSLTIHAGYNAYENGVLKKNMFKYSSDDRYISVSELISSWIAPTASIMYRASARQLLDIPFQGNIKLGDYPLLIYLGLNGSVYYFAKPMSVYRNGSIASVSKLYKSGASQVRHNEQMIELLNRIDQYTVYKYRDTINATKDKRLYQILLLKNDIEGIKQTEVYQRMGCKEKIRLYLVIYSKLFKVLRRIKNLVVQKIRYIFELRYTKAIQLPNIVILDK